MAFESFQLSRIEVGEATLRVRHGGSGPPLLLLHGYPETHMMWGKVADDLARDFTVVAPDLRGYGQSSKVEPNEGHESYSKRAMARDAVALMEHFGFSRFDLAGHDRGGRVGYRLALDYPQSVRRLSVLDIIPTSEVWGRADKRFALGYWHWAFLAQPAPFPEQVLAHDAESILFRLSRNRGIFDPEAYADYLKALEDPGTLRAICEDYRAGASYDVAADKADFGRTKIACPVQVLWGTNGAQAAWYDVMAIWRDWAYQVEGHAIEAGHFIPEEKPAETLAAFRDFFLR